jgi:adenosylcobinamide amidohydrolase
VTDVVIRRAEKRNISAILDLYAQDKFHMHVLRFLTRAGGRVAQIAAVAVARSAPGSASRSIVHVVVPIGGAASFSGPAGRAQTV